MQGLRTPCPALQSMEHLSSVSSLQRMTRWGLGAFAETVQRAGLDGKWTWLGESRNVDISISMATGREKGPGFLLFSWMTSESGAEPSAV